MHKCLSRTSSLSPADTAPGGDDLGSQLMEACRAGDLAAVSSLVEAGADPACARPADGLTPLMVAAEEGAVPVVSALLEAGAPWNAQDKDGYTAGEYARPRSEAWQLLLDWGVRAELLLSHARRARPGADAQEGSCEKEESANAAYLRQKLRYEDGKLMDEDGEAVMMGWETPLMELHADVVCGPVPGARDVLNVGFGLGIIDAEIQARRPRSHTIIEAHPDVYARMVELGWDRKPGVRIIFGRWQDAVRKLLPGSLDGIFFDTYSEYYEDQREFQAELPRLLRPGGVYSFFNGLAPDNMFFHLVYGEIARREFNAAGFSVKYDAVPIDASANEIWEGVANRYWHLPVYFLPTCVLESRGGGGEEGSIEGK